STATSIESRHGKCAAGKYEEPFDCQPWAPPTVLKIPFRHILDRRQMRLRHVTCLIPALLLLTGCAQSAPDVAPVSGRITLDGKPREFAVATFQPDGKSPATSGTDKDGHYELMYKRGVMGAPLGMNRVSILLDVEQAHRPQIPPQADLQREVKPGPNVFDFDLTSNTK